MNTATMAGLGQALRNVPAEYEAQRKLQMELERQALAKKLAESEISHRLAEEARAKAQEGRAGEQWGLNKQVLQHTVDEIPQKDAATDFAKGAAIDPLGWFNNPQMVQLAQTAKIPLQLNPTGRDVEAEQGGQSMANRIGYAPQTGVQIPLDVKTKIEQDQRALAQAKMQQEMMANPGAYLSNFMNALGQQAPTQAPTPPSAPQVAPSAPPSAPQVPPVAPVGNVPAAGGNKLFTQLLGTAQQKLAKPNPIATAPSANPLNDPSARVRMALDMYGKLSGSGLKSSDVLPAPGQMPAEAKAHAFATTQGRLEASGVSIGQMQQRAAEQGKLAKDNYDQAITAMEKLYPGIEQEFAKQEAMANSPQNMPSIWQRLTGNGGLKYSGVGDVARASGERAMYSSLGSPYHIIPQASSFANLEGMAAIMPGVRGFQTLQGKFNEHQPNWGLGQSPLNTYSRLRTLRDKILPEAIQLASTPQTAPYVPPEERQ